MKKLSIEPKPDFERLRKVLTRDGIPDRVPFYELFSNIQDEVLAAIGKLDQPGDATAFGGIGLQRHIRYMFNLGYDYINMGGNGFGFPQKERPKVMTAQGERSYLQADSHTIENRDDFEKYPWPDMSRIDYSPLEKVGDVLPAGMKVISSSSGMLENVMWLLGYEGISYMIHDDPAFVRKMFEAVAVRIIEYLDKCAAFPVVGAIVMGDDMGHKTQTLLSPAVYREFLFPWHKQLVEAVHRHGKPIILHACGNLTEVMEDIIACGWDARHSFEDAIEPVWEAKRKYGKRIALLGGFDMDKISRMAVKAVRKHTHFLLQKCAPGGGWALGTGNSVANYVPAANFLAMLDEGYRGGRY